MNCAVIHDRIRASKAPAISVLTTVFNREEFLSECIESILSSSFSDFELIILDDQSSDNSLDVALSYARKDSRIRLFQNERNLGDYPNRNAATTLARGDYLKFVDADDCIGRFTLQLAYEAMTAHDSAAIGFFDFSSAFGQKPTLLAPTSSFSLYYQDKLGHFDRSPLSTIIKASSFQAVGGFSGKRNVGDFELWQTISQNEDCLIIPAAPVFWRQHDNQESSMNRTNPIVPLRYLILSRYFLSQKETPLTEITRNNALIINQRRIARSILRLASTFQFSTMNKMRKEAELTWLQIICDSFR